MRESIATTQDMPARSDAADSAPAKRIAHIAHRFGLMLVIGLLLISFWALIAWLAGIQKERTLSDGARELAVIDDAALQQADGLLKEVETDLRIMAVWLQTHPHAGVDPVDDAAFRAFVDELRMASGGTVELGMSLGDGRIVAIPRPGAASIAAAGDVELMSKPASRAGWTQALDIGLPVASGPDGAWRLPVTWRLATPMRQVAVLVAEVDLAAFARAQDRVRLTPAGSVLLLGNDGLVLSRAPFDSKRIGKHLGAAPAILADSRSTPRGSYVSDGRGSDGVARLVSYQRSARYPVTVMATREMRDVLSDFESRRRLVFGLCAGVTLLTLCIAAFLQRLQRALDHAQKELERLASIDHLTDVMNRRALSDLAQREFSRAQRLRRPVAVLALDIDHFKRVNDSHGHSAGDQVLKECASRWKSSLRAHDLLGRMGGEEFCAVLPDTSPEAARLVAQRLRMAVIEPPLTGVARVTVSIGVSSWQPSDGQWSTALDRADKALYRAKAAGRDRVCEEDATA